MRLSPDGRRLVYVAGLGQNPPAPMVTVVLEDGARRALEPGHDPVWALPTTVMWSPQDDGRVRAAVESEGWLSVEAGTGFALPAGNTLAAGGGLAAVGRTDSRRVLLSNGRAIYGAMDPAISDNGRWLAYVMADRDAAGNVRDGVSTLWVERANGSGGIPRALWEGAPTRPRFGGTTLAWEVGRGIIAGCADVSNPAIGGAAFTLPSAWKLTHPVPVWVPARNELLVLVVADAGDTGAIYLATWTSLKQGEPRGYALGSSTGSAFDHDARPVGSTSQVAVSWLDPVGLVDGLTQELASGRVILAPPVKPEPPVVVVPPALPDQRFVVDPNGVIEDVSEWLFSSSQGPDIHLSPDGDIRFFCKSDEGSGDGPFEYIGEHWDRDALWIGHLDDASTGRRVLNGRAVVPTDIPADVRAATWAGLKLSHNWFNDGKRLWMPRRLVSGTVFRYVTDINWNSTTPETPKSTVWKSIPIEIRVDVGYGVYQGKVVRARVSYIPDGNGETNYYGPPNGYNAWIIAAGKSDPWAGHPA